MSFLGRRRDDDDEEPAPRRDADRGRGADPRGYDPNRYGGPSGRSAPEDDEKKGVLGRLRPGGKGKDEPKSAKPTGRVPGKPEDEKKGVLGRLRPGGKGDDKKKEQSGRSPFVGSGTESGPLRLGSGSPRDVPARPGQPPTGRSGYGSLGLGTGATRDEPGTARDRGDAPYRRDDPNRLPGGPRSTGDRPGGLTSPPRDRAPFGASPARRDPLDDDEEEDEPPRTFGAPRTGGLGDRTGSFGSPSPRRDAPDDQPGRDRPFGASRSSSLGNRPGTSAPFRRDTDDEGDRDRDRGFGSLGSAPRDRTGAPGARPDQGGRPGGLGDRPGFGTPAPDRSRGFQLGAPAAESKKDDRKSQKGKDKQKDDKEGRRGPFGFGKKDDKKAPGGEKLAKPTGAVAPPASRSGLGALPGAADRAGATGRARPETAPPSSRASQRAPASAAASRRAPSRRAAPLPESKSKGAFTLHQGLDRDRRIDLIGIALVAFGLVAFFAVIPSVSFGLLPTPTAGLTGALDNLLSQGFGWGKLVWPLAAFALGIWLMKERFEEREFDLDYIRIIGAISLFACALTWAQMIELINDPAPTVEAFRPISYDLAVELGRGGGWVGHQIYLFLLSQFLDYGTVSVLVAWLVVSLMFTFDLSLVEVWGYVLAFVALFRLTPPEERARKKAAKAALNAEGPDLKTPPAPAAAAVAAGPRQLPLESGAGPRPAVAGADRASPLINRRSGAGTLETGAAAPADAPKPEIPAPAVTPLTAVAANAAEGIALATAAGANPAGSEVAKPAPSRRFLPHLRKSDGDAALTDEDDDSPIIEIVDDEKPAEVSGRFGFLRRRKPEDEPAALDKVAAPSASRGAEAGSKTDEAAAPSGFRGRLGRFGRGAEPVAAEHETTADAPEAEHAAGLRGRLGRFGRGAQPATPDAEKPAADAIEPAAQPDERPRRFLPGARPVDQPAAETSTTEAPAVEPPAASDSRAPAADEPKDEPAPTAGRTPAASPAAAESETPAAESPAPRERAPFAARPGITDRRAADEPPPDRPRREVNPFDNGPRRERPSFLEARPRPDRPSVEDHDEREDEPAAEAPSERTPSSVAERHPLDRPAREDRPVRVEPAPDADADRDEKPDGGRSRPFGAAAAAGMVGAAALFSSLNRHDEDDASDDSRDDAPVVRRPNPAREDFGPPAARGRSPLFMAAQRQGLGEPDEDEEDEDDALPFDDVSDEDDETEEELFNARPARPAHPELLNRRFLPGAMHPDRPQSPAPNADKDQPAEPGAPASADGAARPDAQPPRSSRASITRTLGPIPGVEDGSRPVEDALPTAGPGAPAPEPEKPAALRRRSSKPAPQPAPPPSAEAPGSQRPARPPVDESTQPADAATQQAPAPTAPTRTPAEPSKPKSEPALQREAPRLPTRPTEAPGAAPIPVPAAAPTPGPRKLDPAIVDHGRERRSAPPAPAPAQQRSGGAKSRWEMPDYRKLLRKGDEQRIRDEVLLEKARVIEDTLASFGAPGKVVEINPGPVITQFGVEPDYLDGRGGRRTRVKVGAIARLDADLALALAAKSIRIEAPVPGRGFVGIEVPNDEVANVNLHDIMSAPEFRGIDSKLRVALGLSVDGTPVAADLTAMPHLLIAGTTGSGKSVCVNSIISSLLLENSPDDVQLIMVDPKRVELTGYNGIPHLVAPVVVELERIVGVLQWTQREMEERYRKFAAMGARNILDYNKRLKPDEKRMPYYVVIVDELADLMMLAPDETERLLARLAQMARATGIHLIISTQRPSVDIITGLIKANFPARIAFAVASGVDSRVILDQPGAEKLLGRGDMLFQSPDAPAPMRMQGVYVSDDEINAITAYWRGQGLRKAEASGSPGTLASPNREVKLGARPTDDDAPTAPASQSSLWDDEDDGGEGDDQMYQEAVELVQRLKKASISLLQRRLRIGYTRAARLIDKMEADGIIGPAQEGSKPREVIKFTSETGDD